MIVKERVNIKIKVYKILEEGNRKGWDLICDFMKG